MAIGANQNDENGNNAGHVRVYENNNIIVKTLQHKGISIYPNPTSGEINFKFENNNIKILDIVGKKKIEITKIEKNEAMLHTLDLSCFENGIYIINIQSDNEIFSTKIIKI